MVDFWAGGVALSRHRARARGHRQGVGGKVTLAKVNVDENPVLRALRDPGRFRRSCS